MKEEINGVETQMSRVRQDRANDVNRLEEKLASTRKEKMDNSKDTEKLRLKLRASSREIDELRRQINILKSEEEWRKKEITRLQQGAKDEITRKNNKCQKHCQEAQSAKKRNGKHIKIILVPYKNSSNYGEEIKIYQNLFKV